MKKITILFAMMLISCMAIGQQLTTTKVTIINDSIYEMGSTNGREQILIASKGVNKSIIVESIAIVNKVGAQRLYSPDSGISLYKIGYRNGAYWYDVTSFSWETLNIEANASYSFIPSVDKTIWDGSKINNSPLVIRFDKPMNFTQGSNELSVYVTYWVIE